MAELGRFGYTKGLFLLDVGNIRIPLSTTFCLSQLKQFVTTHQVDISISFLLIVSALLLCIVAHSIVQFIESNIAPIFSRFYTTYPKEIVKIPLTELLCDDLQLQSADIADDDFMSVLFLEPTAAIALHN